MVISPITVAGSPALEPIPVLSGRGVICREALESLPEWFGIPAAIERYVVAAEILPMLACFEPAGRAAGFVSVKMLTPAAAEMHVLGVKRSWHRQGIGRRLVEAAGRLAASEGARFLTVKTLSPAKVDPHYERTRRFYEAVGFVAIEEFPTLWGADNPCVLMLRSLPSPS